jgi:nucleoside-diphosphate-sugar epimerase
MQVTMSTVAVTGGSGFIGKKLVESLCRDGFNVTLLSRRDDVSFPQEVKVVKGDLTTEDCPLVQFLEGCETVFHCAGELGNEVAMRPLHVDGTRRLLQAVQTSAKQTGKVIHWIQLSSVGAYGPTQSRADSERIVTEETQVNPCGEYEVTKTLSDEMVIQAGKDGYITYSIVRPSNVFGAGMPNQSLRQLAKMVQKGLFFYIGRPGAVATYVHVDDVVEVLQCCGMNDCAKGEVFNVSNDCTIEEMISGMATALAVAVPRLRLPEALVRAAIHVVSKVVKVPLTQERVNALMARTRYPYSKLEQELGFVPRNPVPRMIEEVVDA